MDLVTNNEQHETATVEAQVKDASCEEAEVSDATSLPKPTAPSFDEIKETDDVREIVEVKSTDVINDGLEHVETDGEAKEEAENETLFEEGLIWDYFEHDVLSGRGAWVNAHRGNQKFRALCFSRKPEFDAGNHAAKRRIATEVVEVIKTSEGRFLRKKDQKGPWYEMTFEQSILKACQVMRDHKRPDRVAMREAAIQSGNQRRRIRSTESTPMGDIPVAPAPAEPIIENPYGVNNNDVLSGRGAYVNGHVGNQRFREWAMERKLRFDAGNFADKRTLATEIVQMVRNLDPPGRFLKRIDSNRPPKGPVESPAGMEGQWELLNDERAIHKACQVMRDIDRPDRKDRGSRKKRKLEGAKKEDTDMDPQPTGEGSSSVSAGEATPDAATTDGPPDISVTEPSPFVDEPVPADSMDITATSESKDAISILAENTVEASTIEEAMAATEEALNKALDAVPVKVEESNSNSQIDDTVEL